MDAPIKPLWFIVSLLVSWRERKVRLEARKGGTDAPRGRRGHEGACHWPYVAASPSVTPRRAPLSFGWLQVRDQGPQVTVTSNGEPML